MLNRANAPGSVGKLEHAKAIPPSFRGTETAGSEFESGRWQIGMRKSIIFPSSIGDTEPAGSEFEFGHLLVTACHEFYLDGHNP